MNITISGGSIQDFTAAWNLLYAANAAWVAFHDKHGNWLISCNDFVTAERIEKLFTGHEYVPGLDHPAFPPTDLWQRVAVFPYGEIAIYEDQFVELEPELKAAMIKAGLYERET